MADLIAADVSTETVSEMLGTRRQADLVARARDAARDALAALGNGTSPEYAATHCDAALAALADLVGETTSEDVLGRLFATFCIGK
jgi:tRNA modification GTPase